MKEAFERFMRAVDIDQFREMKNSTWGKDTSYVNVLHLFIIGHSEKTTVSELAENLGLSRPAVTQKINELERHGLIQKMQSDEDKRVFYITLSDMVKQSAEKTKTAHILEVVDATFSAEKKAIFEEILNFMSDYIDGVVESKK